jgi:anti-sigma-K factor RskA
MDVHDLTPAYALDALDAPERESYEAHLGHCERCRAELAELSEAAAALAWAVDAPAPPDRLRARILEEAGAGRENVVPLRVRRAWQGVAAVAACAAVGLGIWGATLSHSLDRERARASALAIVADPTARRADLSGGQGVVAVARDGRGVLVVHELPAAPDGKTYEAWVIPQGGRAVPAGTFAGGTSTTVVRLAARVTHGDVVAATIERTGGVAQPTSRPILTART